VTSNPGTTTAAGRRRRRLGALALVIVAVTTTACGSEDQPDTAAAASGEPTVIRMGWGIPAEEIKYLMKENPELAPNLGEEYTIEWNQFAGTALGVQGLAAGTLDAATVGSLSVANGLDQGADIVITGEFIEEREDWFSTTWLVGKDSGINTVADLKGKTVATSAVGGSTDYLQDAYIQEEAGLVANQDYKKVDLPFAQQLEALSAGQIDMGLFPQPFYAAAMATGKFKPIFTATDVQPQFVQLLQGFRREFVEENPEAVKAFLEDWERVAEYMSEEENRADVIAASSASTKIPATVLEPFLLTDEDFYRPCHGAVNQEALQGNWDFFRERGGIKKDLQVEDHVMDEFLPEEC